ncbi:MAG: hypothetical protein R3C44_04845 [Chloroflexota bacterium]
MAQWAWPYQLDEPITQTASSDDDDSDPFQDTATTFLVATRSGRLMELDVADSQPMPSWTKDGLGGATSLFWDDLDKDGRPDTGLIGTRFGNVYMFRQMDTLQPQQVLELDLESAVVSVAMLRRTSGQSPDLLTITENSLIRFFRGRKQTPLLTHPNMNADSRQLSASVSVTDVENDRVTVLLEMFNPEEATWQRYRSRFWKQATALCSGRP